VVPHPPEPEIPIEKEEDEYYGTLTITILEGNFNKDMDIFGEMDPYVIIEHRGTKHRTKTIRSGGRNPKWNPEESKYVLRLLTEKDTVEISAWDQDFFYDDFIGKCVLKTKAIQHFKYN